MKDYRIGVDIGGTNIAAAIVSGEGRILYKKSNPTNADKGPQESINVIISTIRELMTNLELASRVKGIGIGVPGVCDIRNGIVEFAPNLFWNDVKIVEIVEKEFSLPTYIDNDANAAALGEAWCGAGRGKKNIVCITLGTGVGSGVILNGDIFHGANNGAGELGHITVIGDGPKCNCGNTGCLEALVAAPAILKAGKKAVKEGKKTTLSEIKFDKLTTKDVFDGAKKGDEVSLEIVMNVANNLGLALANVVNILNPEQIIIGGGVAAAGDILFNPLKEVIKKRALKGLCNGLEIVEAQLGNDAGIVGAAALVK